MLKDGKILLGKNSQKEVYLYPSMAQRHGLITGASGTGKTITSKVMAESFSSLGVPVFMADVKGDIAGTAVIGEMNDNISKRVNDLKLDDFEVQEFPVRFFDVFGDKGHHIRARIQDIGPDILSMMLGLTEAQEGILNIIFRIAEDEKIDIDDLKDLEKFLNYISEHRKDYISDYGNITTQSIGVILRSLNVLKNQGGEKFFGEPSFDVKDFVAKDANGKGIINILDAVELYKSPDLYTSVMLFLMTSLYNSMPEVGDVDIPKIVFFFDESYFLFREMPSYRLKQVDKIVRLIRSKGIGLYFISHYTVDIPETILSQLSNRVQHNLKAYTPADQKVAKAAADAFRANPSFKTYDAILELATGEALVSCLTEKGDPEVVERVMILPPQSRIGVIDDMTRTKIINQSPLCEKYDGEIEDDESAYEILGKKLADEKAEKERKEQEKEEAKRLKEEEKEAAKKQREEEKAKREAERKKKNSVAYKTGKRVSNRAQSFFLTKFLNAVWKKIFK